MDNLILLRGRLELITYLVRAGCWSLDNAGRHRTASIPNIRLAEAEQLNGSNLIKEAKAWEEKTLAPLYNFFN